MPGHGRGNASGSISVCRIRSSTVKPLPSKRARWRTAPLRYELDMTSGNFDPSLAKYKPQKQESISVSDLFHQFIEYKRRKIEPATFAKYLGLEKHVSAFFKNKSTISVSETAAEKFRDWLCPTSYLSWTPEHLGDDPL